MNDVEKNSKCNSGTVFLAEEQTNGKGSKRGDNRKDRKWSSKPKGNLYFSFLYKMKNPKADDISKLRLSIPISMAYAIQSVLATKTPRIKWPNDIFVDGKKICGFLMMSSKIKDQFSFNIGIGVNCFEDMTKNETIKDIATSIFNSLGHKTFNREDILAVFFNILETMLEKDLEEVSKENERFSIFETDQELTIYPSKKEVKDKSYKAYFVGFEKDGSLIVEVNGNFKTLLAGEVSIKV